MTGQDHEYAYWELDDLEKRDPLPSDFDLVALSSYSAKIGTAYELSERYRALGIPTIGGPHVSCLPEEAAAHCDAVVLGKRVVVPEVLRDCELGRLRRCYLAIWRPGSTWSGPDARVRVARPHEVQPAAGPDEPGMPPPLQSSVQVPC